MHTVGHVYPGDEFRQITLIYITSNRHLEIPDVSVYPPYRNPILPHTATTARGETYPARINAH